MFDLVFKHTIEMLQDRQYILPKYIKNELLKDPKKVLKEPYNGTVFVKKSVMVESSKKGGKSNEKEANEETKVNSEVNNGVNEQKSQKNTLTISSSSKTNFVCLNDDQTELQQYKKVMVFFSMEKFGVKQLRVKVENINNLSIDHVIFILDTKFTSHGQRLLNKHAQLEEEIFYFHEMLINPVQHYLVPKHELLTLEETQLFYQNVGKKIACIKVSERICRHFNGKIGQIFRIYRKNGPYFRMVVA